MRILVVEDEMVIADSLCEHVVSAGHQIAGLAADEDSAIELLGMVPVDLVLIDIGLSKGMTGFEVASVAAQRQIPFVFTTGNFRLVVGDFAGAIGMIAKPYSKEAILQALHYLDRLLNDGAADAPPKGLVLALPWIARLGLVHDAGSTRRCCHE